MSSKTRTPVGFIIVPALLLIVAAALITSRTDEHPDWREYRPGMRIADDEQVITAGAFGNDGKISTSEALRVRVEINDIEIYNKLIDRSPWTQAYVLTFGSYIRIDVSQGYTWGAYGCTIHQDGRLLDEAEGMGKGTASCAYRG